MFAPEKTQSHARRRETALLRLAYTTSPGGVKW
jgi:hypothetical protein